MYKIFATNKNDEDSYKRHLFVFKKAFPNFMYNSPYSSKLSSPVHEA